MKTLLRILIAIPAMALVMAILVLGFFPMLLVCAALGSPMGDRVWDRYWDVVQYLHSLTDVLYGV